jgi:hypothetical protein
LFFTEPPLPSSEVKITTRCCSRASWSKAESRRKSQSPRPERSATYSLSLPPSYPHFFFRTSSNGGKPLGTDRFWQLRGRPLRHHRLVPAGTEFDAQVARRNEYEPPVTSRPNACSGVRDSDLGLWERVAVAWGGAAVVANFEEGRENFRVLAPAGSCTLFGRKS